MEPMPRLQIKLQSLALMISVDRKYLANSLINKILHARKILPHIKEKVWLCRHKASTGDDWSDLFTVDHAMICRHGGVTFHKDLKTEKKI